MAEVGLLSAISAGATAIASIRQGQAARSAANFQAAQLQAGAQAKRAEAQRQALEDKRRIELARSRAEAIGAASGRAGGKTMTDVIGGLEYEADRALKTRIAAGENVALGYETSAAAAKQQGKAAMQAGVIGAAASAAKFGSSLYDKYYPSDTYTAADESAQTPWIEAGALKPWYMR